MILFDQEGIEMGKTNKDIIREIYNGYIDGERPERPLPKCAGRRRVRAIRAMYSEVCKIERMDLDAMIHKIKNEEEYEYIKEKKDKLRKEKGIIIGSWIKNH
ncbi:MAG: hypothetical protein ACMUIG_04650 [Thermoplasmatota archaeon]